MAEAELRCSPAVPSQHLCKLDRTLVLTRCDRRSRPLAFTHTPSGAAAAAAAATGCAHLSFSADSLSACCSLRSSLAALTERGYHYPQRPRRARPDSTNVFMFRTAFPLAPSLCICVCVHYVVFPSEKLNYIPAKFQANI